MTVRKAFISYASEDGDVAARLYAELSLAPGLRPWLDKQDLVAGTRWASAIRKAIRDADVFILLLSSSSTTKRGFVQREVRAALGVLDSLPEESVFVIPVRVEDCEVHFESLADIHYIDLFPDWDEGIRQLRRALSVHLGIPEKRHVDRSPPRREEPPRASPLGMSLTARFNVAAMSLATCTDGVLLGEANGQLAVVDPAGVVMRRRQVASDGSGISSVLQTNDRCVLVGTESGEVLRLRSWSSYPTKLMSVGVRVRGLHQRDDGAVLVTAGAAWLAWLNPSGTLAEMPCPAPAFAMAAGRATNETVVAVARPGTGGLVHAAADLGSRYEAIHLINALGLHRSPLRALYALGRAYGGVKLLDYASTPPGNGAKADGWDLSTETIVIYEDIVGEAFDPYVAAAGCVAVSFSPDGRYVVGGHDGGQVAVWNVETGEEVANALAGDGVVGIAFVGDRDVVVATRNGVHIFEFRGVEEATT